MFTRIRVHSLKRDRGTIIAPMPTGSGAIVVHRQLERFLPNYRVLPFSPMRELFPPLIGLQRLVGASIVHTTPDHATFLARPGVPLVITFHNLVVDAFMRRYSSLLQRLHYSTDLRWLIRRALRRADAVTAVSEFTRELVRAEFDFTGAISVVPNGVDVGHFKPREADNNRDPIKVLFAGNLTPRKGAKWIAEVAAKLPLGTQLICASSRRGPGSDMLPKRKNVRVLDNVDHRDMPEIYRDADIFLLPSVREGMSLAILEAMASGLPVVATDNASNPELVHPQRGGYLCPLGDVDAFVSAVRELAESPERRREMGLYNRFIAESRYGVLRMAASYAAIFDQFKPGVCSSERTAPVDGFD